MSRWLLQKIGTEIFRKQIDPEFWVKQAGGIIESSIEGGENLIIDDVRFPNEAEIIKKFDGLLVRTVREDFTDSLAGNTHESERYVMTIPVHFEIRAKSGEIAKLIDFAEQIAEMISATNELVSV